MFYQLALIDIKHYKMDSVKFVRPLISLMKRISKVVNKRYAIKILELMKKVNAFNVLNLQNRLILILVKQINVLKEKLSSTTELVKHVMTIKFPLKMVKDVLHQHVSQGISYH